MRLLCPRCGEPSDLACVRCGAAVPLTPGADPYAALGLAPRLGVTAAELDAARLERAALTHPDRFPAGSPDREIAVRNATLVNDAYRVLRDPFERGRWWLESRGVRLASAGGGVPAALADRVFEVQEALAGLRSRPGDAALRTRVESARAEVTRDAAARTAALEEAFRRHDAAPGSVTLEEIRRGLAELKYVLTLRERIEEVLEA
ncbi:MAG: hypothetical protein L0216_02130 [Planctomycetales bacterium]|nr:hypothetical protein [Planctomycetales bacterium]